MVLSSHCLSKWADHKHQTRQLNAAALSAMKRLQRDPTTEECSHCIVGLFPANPKRASLRAPVLKVRASPATTDMSGIYRYAIQTSCYEEGRFLGCRRSLQQAPVPSFARGNVCPDLS